MLSAWSFARRAAEIASEPFGIACIPGAAMREEAELHTTPVHFCDAPTTDLFDLRPPSAEQILPAGVPFPSPGCVRPS